MHVYTPKSRSKLWILLVILFVLLAAAAVAAMESYSGREAVSRRLASIDLTDHPLSDAKDTWKSAYTAKGVSVESAIAKDAGKNTYVTPEGFRIVSHSEKWTGDKLKEIYKEMLNNAHGTELQYINSVIVYPYQEEWGDSTILGTQSAKDTLYEVSLGLPAVIPDTAKYSLTSSTSDITLYNMDSYDTAAEAARTIAHEYGHHFTRFYFLKDGVNYRETDYYKLRGLSKYSKAKVYVKPSDYKKYYAWDILEMAAEDYVQILGSKNAKQQEEYMDAEYWLHSGSVKNKITVDNNDYNVLPQNNTFIPLASQVKGLDSYFHSFIKDGYESPDRQYPEIKIKFKKQSANGFTYYNVTWNAIPGAKGALYTLLCYKKDGSLFAPVKTVRAGGKMTAVIGTPSYLAMSIFYWDDHITDASRYFKVTVLLKDGTVISSKPVLKSF
jgi:hypothetical protein